MNKDEEADEIVRRLKAPPVRLITARWTVDDLSDVTNELARAISEEIDKEILGELMRKLGK
jgi:hypothetical protein